MKTDEDLVKKLKKALRRPRTVDELVEMTGALRRRVYRYLEVLVERGEKVTRRGIRRPTKYVIGV